MEQLEVKITIPKSEYEKWIEFENGGKINVKHEFTRDVREFLRNQYIKEFGVESEIIKDL